MFFQIDNYEKLSAIDTDDLANKINTFKAQIDEKIEAQQELSDTENTFLELVKSGITREQLESAKTQAQFILQEDWRGLFSFWHPDGEDYDNFSVMDTLRIELHRKVEQRNIKNLDWNMTTISFLDPFGYSLGLSRLRHIVYQQDVGRGGLVSVAIRMTSFGNQDVSVSWRVFERNTEVEKRQRLPYLILFIIGMFAMILAAASMGQGVKQVLDSSGNRSIFTFFAFAFNPTTLILLAIMAWFIYQSYQQWLKVLEKQFQYSSATIYQQFESRLLATAISDSFMELLDDYGIQPEQIRVVRNKQEERLAELTVPREPLIRE